jgi:hypothetical protein
VGTHQRDVRLFVGRIHGDELQPSAADPQQLPVEVGDAVPAGIRPRLVAVLGQELAGEEPEGIVDADTGLQCSPGRRFETNDVHRHLVGRQETERVTHPGECVCAERASSEVDGLVEARRRVGGCHIRPQHLHHLLAVQPAIGREGQGLDQVRRRTSPPLRVIHHPSVQHDRERPEHDDLIDRPQRGRPVGCGRRSAVGVVGHDAPVVSAVCGVCSAFTERRSSMSNPALL